MRNKKNIAIIMAIVIMMTMLILPGYLGAFADQKANLFENLPVIVDRAEVDVVLSGADDTGAGDADSDFDRNENNVSAEANPDNDSLGDNDSIDDTGIDGDSVTDENESGAIFDDDLSAGESEPEEDATANDEYWTNGNLMIATPQNAEGFAVPLGEDQEISYDSEGRTMLDISVADVVIDPATGASGGDLNDAEGELNTKGYYIYSGLDDKTATHKLTLNGSSADDFPARLPIVLQDGLSITTETAPLDLGSFANVELTLTNNTLHATHKVDKQYHGKYAGLRIYQDSDVILNITGNNYITSDGSTGLLLCYGASLTINGKAQDKLYATGRSDKGNTAGIGLVTESNSSRRDAYDIRLFKSLVINGGQIYAQGQSGRTHIGSYRPTILSGDDDLGKITINAGYVETPVESSLAGGTIAIWGKSSDKNLVIIDGGSINAKIEHTTTSIDGELRKIVVTVPDNVANATFSLPNNTDSDLKWEAAAKDGKLYLYMPVDGEDSIVAACDGKNYTGEIVGDDTNGYTAELVLNEASCSCKPGEAALVLDDRDVIVYDFLGKTEITLDAKFNHSANCEYQLYRPTVTYALADDVPQEYATLDGKVLTIYPEADGKTLEIIAKTTIGGEVFETTADFDVVLEDKLYLLDICDGDIVIDKTTITVGETEYPRDNQSREIKIVQSKKPSANHIKVEGWTTANITIEDLDLAVDKNMAYVAHFHVGLEANVRLKLVGENRIDGYVNDFCTSGTFYPAVYIGSSVDTILRIEGDGSLWARGGHNKPAIGGRNDGSYGTLIVDSGKVIAIGGQGITIEENAAASVPGTAGIGAGAEGVDGHVIINGGMVLSANRDRTGRGDVRDITANIVINGGSVATLDDDDNLSADICLYKTGTEKYPVNSNGDRVYRTILTVEDAVPNQPVQVWVSPVGAEEYSFTSFTDADSKLYVYLPANDDYQSIALKANDTMYYKRLIVEADDDNAATLVKGEPAKIVAFELPGQLGEAKIDHDAGTIEVAMPKGTNLSSLTPIIDTDGAEYRQEGPQDFSKSVEYLVIADTGLVSKYAVNVTMRDPAVGETMVLNVAFGDVYLEESAAGAVTVRLGGLQLPANSNGYIITGTNDDATIEIIGVNTDNHPVTLQDLNLANNTSGTYVIKLDNTNNRGFNIDLAGTNYVRGLKNQTGLLLVNTDNVESDFVLSGEGILKFNANADTNWAGTGVDVSASGSKANFIIDGGSVFITQDGRSKQTVNHNAKKTYPIEIVVANDLAKNTIVTYQDTSMDEPRRYLTDENGKIVVYRAKGVYGCTVAFGENFNEICTGSVEMKNVATSVTLGVSRVTKVQNMMQASALGSKNWQINVEGEYLGGTVEVIATGSDGSISGYAEPLTATTWVAYLDIPDNSHAEEYTYTLTVKVNGKLQQVTGSFTMKKELSILTFELDQKGYQIGEAVFTTDENGRYINVTVPYDLEVAEVPISATMTPANAYYNPASGTLAVYSDNGDRSYSATYTISSSNVLTEGSYVDYKVTLTRQPVPTITGLTVDEVRYSGGDVKITIDGTNLDSVVNAVNYQYGKDNSKPKADQVVVRMNNKEYYLQKAAIKNGKTTLTVYAPPNVQSASDPLAGTENIDYPISVFINGEEQTITEMNGETLPVNEPVILTVPGELVVNAKISSAVYDLLLPDYTVEENAEIKGKYGIGFNEAKIVDNGDDENGTIDILVPYRTDLAVIVPTISTVNVKATHQLGVKKMATDGMSFTQDITVTAVSGDTKTYTLTVTRVATDAEKDAEIKDLVFDASELVFDQNYDMTANALKLNQAVIDQAAGTIDILVPWRTKLADITSVITLGHTLAQVDLVGKLPVQGTENPVTFTKDITVTAVDGTTKTYTLTVTRVATDAEKDATIHAVVIEDMISAEIATTPDEKTGLLTVTVTVNRGLDLSKITPELVLGHQDATYTPQGEQDFSESSGNPIEYVVTAVDGTQLKYGLTIVQKKKSNSNNVKLERTEETREMPAYVTGKDDGNFHPEDVMSRAEAATMLARVHSKFDKSAEYPANYVDVPKGAWYGNYVGFLSEQGVVKGNDNGEFKPAADVTRMEFAAMLARFADLAIDAEAVTNLTDIAGTWGEAEVTALVNSGVINGYEDGTFRPNNKLSRAEAVAMVNRMMKRGTTKQELAELAKVSNPFSDIDESHWAYNDVISAVTDYQVYVKTETLGSIHDEWVTVTVSGADEAHENAE